MSVSTVPPASEITTDGISRLGHHAMLDGDRIQVELHAASRPAAAEAVMRLFAGLGIQVLNVNFGAYREPYGEEATTHAYRVIFRGYAAFRLRDEMRFVFSDDQEESAPSLHAVFATTTVHSPADNAPCVTLWADVVLNAPNVEAATEEAYIIANGMLGIVCLASSSAASELNFERAYDVCTDHDDHEYLQISAYQPPIPFAFRNAPDSERIVSLLVHCFASDEHPRIYRAVQQYRLALDHARPGDELLGVAHCWMGFEALTATFKRSAVDQAGSQDNLCQEWNIELRNLDSEVRRRLVVQDDQVFSVARKVSDAFEHGFRETSGLSGVRAKEFQGGPSSVLGRQSSGQRA